MRAVWFRGHPGQFALLWRKRQVMARKSPFQNKPNPPPFSPWKKKEDINLIGLSRRGERTSALIGWGAQNKRRHVEPGWPALRFQPGVTSLKMCFIIAKPHALQLPYCVLHKAWWNIQDVETRANPSCRHCKGLSLCLLLGSCCPGTQAQGHEKRPSLNYQVHPRRPRQGPICSSGTRKRS